MCYCVVLSVAESDKISAGGERWVNHINHTHRCWLDVTLYFSGSAALCESVWCEGALLNRGSSNLNRQRETGLKKKMQSQSWDNSVYLKNQNLKENEQLGINSSVKHRRQTTRSLLCISNRFLSSLKTRRCCKEYCCIKCRENVYDCCIIER